jgi:surfactin family lipopeptide synthetase A
MVDGTPLSDTKRRLLEKFCRESAGPAVAAGSAIKPRPLGEHAPVSLSQEQLLLREDRTQGGAALYNECITLRMRGPLECSIVERGLSEIIRRHEIWRTSYDYDQGQFIQIVRPAPGTIALPVVDLRELPGTAREAEIHRVVGEAVRQPFDLKKGPLLRARLFRTADFEHRLFLSAHLSIVDGVSAYQIFPSELAALYRAYSSGRPSPLPSLTVQFGDYAYWQRHWLQGDELAAQVAYWRTQLAGELPVLNWPVDHARPPRETFRGVMRSFDLPEQLVDALRTLSRQEGVTVFMSLLAAFVGLLHRYTQQEDIIVGTPSPSGRKRPEMQGLLGYFLNPVALRFDLAGDPTFQTLLRQTQRVTLEALSNDDVPLELLARELRLKPDPSRNPFFTVAISLQPSQPQLDMEWNATTMDIESGGAPWDLYLAFVQRPTDMVVRVQYNPDLFETETVAGMLEDYQTLLRKASADRAARVSQIEFRLRQGEDSS